MKWQTNDAKQYRLNPNCFEKTKVRWGIFKKLSPTKLHSEQSAPLAANAWQLGEVPHCTQPNVKHKSRCGILPNCLLAVVLLGINNYNLK